MDKTLNSKREKDTIYEIYRACRLCGGGAGYKMPIIQNIVDLDDAEVELKQKIRDCVQIEVDQDDKMPPLICELCVDKVNDFYEFLEMCRQTNKRTRLRLGLPPQSLPRGAPDAADCILGLTEPVYVNEDSDGEPLSKHRKLKNKTVKREPVVRIKLENLSSDRLSRYKSRRLPIRMTRHTSSKDDDISLSNLKSKSSQLPPKSILKKESSRDKQIVKNDSSISPSSRLKRSRDKEPVKLETPTKKVKISLRPAPSSKRPTPKSSPRSTPKPTRILRSPVSSPSPPKRQPSPPRELKCTICGQNNKTPQARANHTRVHIVGFTNPKLACNPCEEWFTSAEEAASHQRSHKTNNIPYTCNKCQADFRRMSDYDEHFENDECLPSTEVPDVKCDVCWQQFPTNNLLDNHRCMGEDYRPGGKCKKCKRNYSILKNLKKHEATCTARKKGDLNIDKHLLAQLRPIQVRVARCDPLLVNVKQDHYDVSCVSEEYGLDDNCYYPYMSSFRIKSDSMVKIHDDITPFCSEDYVHWDSEDSDEDDETCDAILNSTTRRKRVESLTALSLKTIFSRRLLGKVPRKKKRVKIEKAFDSMMADEDEVRMDIDNIINNLEYDDDDNDRSRSCSSVDLLNNFSQDVNNTVEDNDKVEGNDDTVQDNDSKVEGNEDTVQDNDSKVEDNDANVKDNDVGNVNDNIVDDNDTSVEDNDSVNDKSKSVDNDVTNNDILNNDNSIDYKNSTDNVNESKLFNDKDKNKSEFNDNLSKETYLNNESKKSYSINDILDCNTKDKVENNYNVEKNDDKKSMYELDAENDDTKVNDKLNDVNDSNDKIALEDLLSKTTDNKIGLGSIEDFSFDS